MTLPVQNIGPLRTTTDSGRYFQSGLTRGPATSLFRSTVSAYSSQAQVATMIPSTGFYGSGSSGVINLGQYDSCWLQLGVTMSSAATSFDLQARVCATSNGTFRTIMRRSITAGVVQDVVDQDRFTTNGSFAVYYDKLIGPYVDFRGRCNGARGKSWTGTLIPFHSGGGR